MQRYSVDSSFARAVGYDHSLEILEIETHPSGRQLQGHIYQYKGISPRKYASFVSSPSIGKYYNRKIKGQYEEVEVFEEALTSGVAMVDESDFIKKFAIATVDEIALRIAQPRKITY